MSEYNPLLSAIYETFPCKNKGLSFGKVIYHGIELIIITNDPNNQYLGYINASQMCNNTDFKKKDFREWLSLSQSNELIEDVEKDIKENLLRIKFSDRTFPRSENFIQDSKTDKPHNQKAIYSIKGGRNTDIRGFYIHRDLLVSVAIWLSKSFGLKVCRIMEREALREYRNTLQQKEDTITELRNFIAKEFGTVKNKLDETQGELIEVKDELVETKTNFVKVKDELIEVKDELVETKTNFVKVKDELVKVKDTLDDFASTTTQHLDDILITNKLQKEILETSKDISKVVEIKIDIIKDHIYETHDKLEIQEQSIATLNQNVNLLMDKAEILEKDRALPPTNLDKQKILVLLKLKEPIEVKEKGQFKYRIIGVQRGLLKSNSDYKNNKVLLELEVHNADYIIEDLRLYLGKSNYHYRYFRFEDKCKDEIIILIKSLIAKNSEAKPRIYQEDELKKMNKAQLISICDKYLYKHRDSNRRNHYVRSILRGQKHIIELLENPLLTKREYKYDDSN